MSENINFELLLKKYIRLIGEVEGVDYISDRHRTSEMTDEEWEALKRLSKEADQND